jgi:hypothetical protein
MWSALLAPGPPQMVQSGEPCRTIARLVRYCLVEYSGLFAMVSLCLCFSSALAIAAVALMWEFRRVVPPRFQPVWLRPPCVNTDTVRVLVVRTLSLRLPLGRFHLYITTGRSRHYPRFRVFTNRVQFPMWPCVRSVVSNVLGAVRDAVKHQ